MVLQLVSRHQEKKMEGVEKRKVTLKNTCLFLGLSKGIKGLMNCLLDARSLRDRHRSRAESGCHKSAHVRAGRGGVQTEGLTPII